MGRQRLPSSPRALAGCDQPIFLVNIPIGILGVLALRRVPRQTGSPADPGARFDPAAFALLGFGLVLALFGAFQATLSDWRSPAASGALALGLALLACYAWWAPRRSHPPVDLAMASTGQARLALGLQAICSVVAFGTVFLMPIFTESIQGHSAMETGLALLPQGVLMGVGTWAGQRLAQRVELRVLVTAGFSALAAASLLLLVLNQSTPLWVVAGILSGRAIAVGLVTMPLLVALLAPLAENQLADGNTLFSIVQRVGGSVGVSVLAGIVAGAATPTLAVERFHQCGAVLAALALLAAAGSLFLSKQAPGSTTATAKVASL